MTPKGFVPIYKPDKEKRMNVLFFASGSGGNFKSTIEFQKENPELLSIRLLITDRPGIGAINIAQDNNIPVLVYDFNAFCGASPIFNSSVNGLEYWEKSECLHNVILEKILEIQTKENFLFDLVVLAYHRIIRGKLLQYFSNRMINQHPGDLSVLDSEGNRKYIGMDAIENALKENLQTRTSTIMVRDGTDTGEILCQGPWVPYTLGFPLTKGKARKHEEIQKEKSDWPSIKFALKGIAEGRFSLSEKINNSQLKQVAYNTRVLPYEGVGLD